MDITNKTPIIFTVSDGTGETAYSIVRAVKVQFEHTEIRVERFNLIRTQETLERILLQARDCNALVVATLVTSELRVYLMSRSLQLGVKVHDIMFPLLESLSTQLEIRPSSIPNLARKLDSEYFRRIWAIEYTVSHDDGIGQRDLNEADIILIGISRTSKTPLSMYLGHKGYKVANIPLIPGVELPNELFEVDQHKIIGLLIDSDRLAEIRAARVGDLIKTEDGSYADSKKIFEELEWSLTLFNRNKLWPVIDVTGKAIEENAVEVEKIILARFPHLKD